MTPSKSSMNLTGLGVESVAHKSGPRRVNDRAHGNEEVTSMQREHTSQLNELADRLVNEHGGEPRITELPGEDRWEVAALQPHPEFDGTDSAGPTCLASVVVHGDGTDAMLDPGTRVRHVRHPELTGCISHIERRSDGQPSGIPYNVRWDNDGLACDLLGWFYIYGTDHGLEAIDAA